MVAAMAPMFGLACVALATAYVADLAGQVVLVFAHLITHSSLIAVFVLEIIRGRADDWAG